MEMRVLNKMKFLSNKYLIRRFGVYHGYVFLGCLILTSPQGESKYKQRVKILSDATHQNFS